MDHGGETVTVETKNAAAPTIWKRALQSEYWIVGVYVLMIVVFAIITPDFLTLSNWSTTLTFSTETIILAIGQTFVIVTGGIDLSDGALLGLSGILGALIMQHLYTLPVLAIILGVLGALATGALGGWINGLCVTRLKVSPFIVTLGMLGAATGTTYLITNAQDILHIPPAFGTIVNFTLFSQISTSVLVALVIALIAHAALSKTRWGIQLRAVGSHREALARAGGNVNRLLTSAYVLSGLSSGLVGVLLVGRFLTGSPGAGTNDELSAIAAVVIGGASLFGGEGNILNTIIGGLIIATLLSALVLLNVSEYWQMVSVGAIIVAAVYIDQRRASSDA